jgi:hypothetical protein
MILFAMVEEGAEPLYRNALCYYANRLSERSCEDQLADRLAPQECREA